jgi:hypothetical protein
LSAEQSKNVAIVATLASGLLSEVFSPGAGWAFSFQPVPPRDMGKLSALRNIRARFY